MGNKMRTQLKIDAMQIAAHIVNDDYRAAADVFDSKFNDYNYHELSQLRDYVRAFCSRKLNGETMPEILDSI